MIERDPHGLNPHAPGAKLDAGKLRAGRLLQFPRALGAIASIATYGALKYSDGGWQSVDNGASRYLDAAGRHLLAHAKGEANDPESGFPHLWHALWNVTAVVELTEREIMQAGEPPAIPESRGTTSSQLHAMHVEAEGEHKTFKPESREALLEWATGKRVRGVHWDQAHYVCEMKESGLEPSHVEALCMLPKCPCAVAFFRWDIEWEEYRGN